MNKTKSFRILFVCTGNICRSPTADAILRDMVTQQGLAHVIEVDSAATHGDHAGDAPDPRAIETALSRGTDMRDLRARAVVAQDFKLFDWIVPMDGGHHAWLEARAGGGDKAIIKRFTGFLGQPDGNVQDPYYGDAAGFVETYDLIKRGCAAIMQEISRR